MTPAEATRFWEILSFSESPPPMMELVARLDSWLAQHRPAFHANLLPGLSDAAWATFEARIGLKFPDEFRALYQWRNGQFRDIPSFRGNQLWMTADDILRAKELLDSMIGFDFPSGWWDRAWVPFLHNGGGSHLCVDVAGTGGGEPGQLVEFWKADPDRPVASPSLGHWLNNFVRSLERDRWEETRVGFECVEVRGRQESD